MTTLWWILYSIVYGMLTNLKKRKKRTIFLHNDDMWRLLKTWNLPLTMDSLEVTAISPSLFRATHSKTFSSRGARSGWIRSTAPAPSSNSMVWANKRKAVNMVFQIKVEPQRLH